MEQLKIIIEQAWENRANISFICYKDVFDAINEA